MSAPYTEKLVRKQFLISPSQIKKLDRIAQDEGTSVAEIVRTAIDHYDPDTSLFSDLDAPELMKSVSMRLKEAIASTRKANRTIDQTLKQLTNGSA
jgi:hypothetical protein